MTKTFHGWRLTHDEFEPGTERLREALCTLGNGYFATRGAAFEESAGPHHYPGTYLAGGYNRAVTKVAGRDVENEDLVNFPNWLPFSFRVPGSDWFHLENVDVLEYKQELNTRRGVLVRRIRFRDRENRSWIVSERRLVSVTRQHVAAQSIEIVPEDWEGTVEFIAALDGLVENNGVERYKDLEGRHHKPTRSRITGEGFLSLEVETLQSRLRVAECARLEVFHDEQPVSHDWRDEVDRSYVARSGRIDLKRGQTARFEKVVSLFTSRDKAISDCGLAAVRETKHTPRFARLETEQALEWRHLWNRFDCRIATNGDPELHRVQQIVRVHHFHLLQTVSKYSRDLDTGAPARGWHGEAYRGHIFWDELFIFPLLNLRIPEITRSLLLYRFRRLKEARRAAREEGLEGAMFPWQSGSDGREESQRLHLNPESGRWIPDSSRLQRHINAAIAFNVWSYCQVTEDEEFLVHYGAEMFLEIARFWVSKTSYNDRTDRYEILQVMGPDEYHEAYPDSDEPGLNNNAYTNVMVSWILARVPVLLARIPQDCCRELLERLRISSEDLVHWDKVSRRLTVPFIEDGIIAQFERYEELEEFDWAGYRKKHESIQRLDRILEAEGDTPNRYKASKQADVVMLFYLFSSEELGEIFERLGYPFSADTIPRNIDYYMQRTSHGSTLSNVVHSWVLARSDRKASWGYFLRALESDVRDIQGGTTEEGIHLGAMAGSVDLVQRCYSGIETRNGRLHLNPRLPSELRFLEFRFRFQRQILGIRITGETMRIESFATKSEPIRIVFRGEEYRLASEERRTFQLKGA